MYRTGRKMPNRLGLGNRIVLLRVPKYYKQQVTQLDFLKYEYKT